jgi:hypothetical protein
MRQRGQLDGERLKIWSGIAYCSGFLDGYGRKEEMRRRKG